MSQAMNSNCFPNLRTAYQKIATSLGAHFQKTQVGVTGFMRMSRSRFLQRWLTVSRYNQIGFFFFQGLVLQISFWGWITWRIGCFFSRRSLTSWTQGWSQLWRLAFLMRQQSLSKFGQVDYSRFCFLWGSAITRPDFISIDRQQTQPCFFITPTNTNTCLQQIVSHRIFFIIFLQKLSSHLLHYIERRIEELKIRENLFENNKIIQIMATGSIKRLIYKFHNIQIPSLILFPRLTQSSGGSNLFYLHYSQQMSEQFTPNVLLAQKSVVDQKQTTIIRKITVDSLSPIIAKLEEHITFLLEETSKLRKENANLTAATALQKSLERQIGDMQEQVEKVSAKMNTFNREKDQKLREKDHEIKAITDQLLKLKKESQIQGKQIVQIGKNNDDYIARIDNNKNEQLASVESLKTNIQRYYEQELIKIQSFKQEFQALRQNIAVVQQKRNADQQQIKELSNICSLYCSERAQIKKMIEKTSYLENNVVLLPDYEKDRRYQKLDNQQTKKDVRKMLDQCLTPQIRKFLPKLISKLGELEQFQATLDKIAEKFQETKINQENKLQELSQAWGKKSSSQEKNIEESLKVLRATIADNYQFLQDKILMNEEKARMRFKPIEDQLAVLQPRWKTKLQHSCKTVEQDLKDYLNVWGQHFLDKKKDNIYQLVQNQKPQQQKQEEKKIQELVLSMQPLLRQVKEELKNAQGQVQTSRETFLERLSFFNNQIVKIKTDINKETTETKRVLDLFNLKLGENKDTCDELSLLLSKLTEISAISYALSLDQDFLHRQHEVYVTYNDGILMQVGNSGNVNYRRKEFVPQMLKRTVLTQLVKIIDNSIVNKPLLSWNKTEFKPSHLFQSLQATYATLCEENGVKESKPKVAPYSDRKSLDSRPHRKQLITHNKNKGESPNNEIFSKTINHDSGEFRAFNSTARYDVGFQENRQYSSRRKNIKLKKIDKKET